MKPLLLLAVPVLISGLVAFDRPGAGATQDVRPIEVPEETDAERIDRKVRELLNLIGAESLMQDSTEQMADAFREMPGLPEGFLDKFLEMVDYQELLDLTIPIYVENLDEATIDATIAFAKTEHGKKLYAAQPAIVQESTAIGMQWGQELAARVLAELDD